MPATVQPGSQADAARIDAARLRQLALDCGADDVGLVEIGHPALDDQRADILKFYPRTKTLLAVVCRMNREPIRNPARSVANLEFHTTGEDVNDVCRAVVGTQLEPRPAAMCQRVPPALVGHPRTRPAEHRPPGTRLDRQLRRRPRTRAVGDVRPVP